MPPIRGQCKLCLQERELLKSHFVPAALWAGVRDPKLKNPNPVVMTRAVAKTSSSQLVERLLCITCEDRLNKNGEQYALSWLAPKKVSDGDFPLLQQLRQALPIESSSALNIYGADTNGVDSEKFAYFALSIFWRAGVQEWRMPDGRFTQKIELGEFEEPFRKYLLSEGSLPPGFVLIFTVCSDEESRQSLFPPARRERASFLSYGILLLGIHFNIIMGDALPLELRNLCFIRAAQHPILLRDCREDTFRAFSAVARTSRPVPALRGRPEG